MMFRESQLGFRTLRSPNGLVVPVNVFDGKYFPKKARDVTWLDCQKYWIVGDGFLKTERYVEFQDVLRAWSEDVATAIGSAPAWDKKWLTAPWLEVSDADIMPPPTRNFEFAGLQ